MKPVLLLALVATTATPAMAQYYERPPPGYYAPRREYDGDNRREYRDDYPRLGRHCNAVLRTPEGPRPLYCRIVEAKPLGMECACPPPPPPPGYPPGPFIPGRTVR